jgi:hypothetical protein
MRAWPALLVAIVLPTAVACSDDPPGDQADAAVTPSVKPTPTPALSKTAAETTIVRYLRSVNRANGNLDPKLAAKIETGSALQVHTAQYKVYRRNDLRYPRLDYKDGLAATPRFVGYPRWFFAAATDRGSSPATRDLLVFVQEQKGGPWKVAYAPYSRTVTGPLAPGVDTDDFPKLAPLDDEKLVLRPDKVAGALATLFTNGGGAQQFSSGRLISSSRTTMAENRKTFSDNGWTGTSRAVAAPTPVYAVRTKSGGALVWFAVDLRHTYRAKGSAAQMTWKTAYGDLHAGFGLPSAVRSKVDRTERTEAVAYIPPKGKGKIQVIGSRWFPVAITGS